MKKTAAKAAQKRNSVDEEAFKLSDKTLFLGFLLPPFDEVKEVFVNLREINRNPVHVMQAAHEAGAKAYVPDCSVSQLFEEASDHPAVNSAQSRLSEDSLKRTQRCFYIFFGRF